MLWNGPCSSRFQQKRDDCASVLSGADNRNWSIRM